MTAYLGIRCDVCGDEYGDVGALTIEDARTIADANGWSCDDGVDACPAHRDVDRAWLLASHEGAFL